MAAAKWGSDMVVASLNNITRKVSLLFAVVAFWGAMTYISTLFLKNQPLYFFTVKDVFSFAYWENFEVADIYANRAFVGDDAIPVFSNGTNIPAVEKFSNLESSRENFSIKYPSSFVFEPKGFQGSDIIYHADFRDKSGPAYGFVQVWNLPGSLENFLNTSKASSMLNFKHFKQQAHKFAGNAGYLWDYSFVSGDGRDIKGMEVFFKKGERMYRISYFLPENMWNSTQQNIFWNMVNSFKVF